MTASSAQAGKIKISPKPINKHPEGHFLPIVKFCLDNGCRFKRKGRTLERSFRSDQGGERHCSMVGPVTMQDVLDVFELPETFKISWESPPRIEDNAYRINFVLYSEQENARDEAHSRATITRARARMEARRISRAQASAKGGE